MSQTKPVLELFYQQGVNPKHYSLHVEIDAQAASPHLMLDSPISSVTNSNILHVVTIQMEQNTQETSHLIIDLGQLNIDWETGLIQVDLTYPNSVETDTIKVKEAKQKSRPIKEL